MIGAVGGSGTRVFSRIARHAGVFMGNRRDDQEDARSLSPFYGEFTTDYLAAHGCPDAAWSARAGTRLLECLREHLEGLPGPEHPWGVKNPRSLLMLPFWHERFPELRFLHVIRDGRDMAYSQAQNQVRRHGRALLGSDMELPPSSVPRDRRCSAREAHRRARSGAADPEGESPGSHSRAG